LTPNALGELSGKLEKAQEGLRSAVELGLDKLRTDNAEKLEQMRSTVDEKLQVTLETASGRELQAGAPLRIFHNGRYAAGGQSRLGGAFYSGGPASLIITLSHLCKSDPGGPSRRAHPTLGLNLTPIPRWPDSEATNGNCPTVRDSDILFMPLRRKPMMADTMASAPAT
jgi:hypothetical protein